MKKPRLEKVIQLEILRYLKKLGAYGGKTKTVGIKRGNSFCFDPYLFRGFPDVSVFWNGCLYFIEVKAEHGTQSPEQKTFQDYCTKANIPYILARSVEDVSSIIK